MLPHLFSVGSDSTCPLYNDSDKNAFELDHFENNMDKIFIIQMCLMSYKYPIKKDEHQCRFVNGIHSMVSKPFSVLIP